MSAAWRGWVVGAMFIVVAVVDASAQVVPDAAREKRHADQVVASLVVGDAVWLTTSGGKRFLGLLTEPAPAKGAVLVLHGAGWHPDHGLPGELRLALAVRGYVTLALQMPVLAVEEDDGSKYQALFPEAADRIAAGVRFLQGKGHARVAIVSHAMGSGMTYHWLKRTPNAPLYAWVALSFYGRWDDDATPFAFPVLDMYGAEDYRGIRWPAVLRKGALDRARGSRQVAVAEGGWFLAGGHATVLRETAAFLDAAPR